MIKANELRIGNYVIGNRGIARVEKIVDEHNDKEIRAWYLNEPAFGAKEDSINPIPLTDEWLLKLGFDKNIIHNTYSIDDFYIMNIIDDYKLLDSDCNSTFGISIRYIHQLQNLYFSLTGEELILNA